MAIARGAGTEIIRSVLLADVDDQAWHDIIIGVQHHIYTVLSVVVKAQVQAGTGEIQLRINGYDAKTGTTNTPIYMVKQSMSLNDTFVFDNKFSFNGYEPIDFTAGLDATKQDAIADQGSGVAQKFQCVGGGAANDQYNLVCTFIDQNNA